ncbi:MAG TPA: TraB/GumN family protein, partial [Segetibacter sp.]|nr:TraB/GumN family protein [Segetibacter sp.]
MRRFLPFLFLFFLLFSSASNAQKKPVVKKYPSLFWEITGNGLKKPSYLFGTMHVSSKMAFHLSDSFYYAMRNTDAVALELNPEVWQDEMFRFQKAQLSLARFSS